MPENCKNYCPWRRYCYAKGEPGLDPDDCPTAWKIEEICNEAKYEPEEDNDD